MLALTTQSITDKHAADVFRAGGFQYNNGAWVRSKTCEMVNCTGPQVAAVHGSNYLPASGFRAGTRGETKSPHCRQVDDPGEIPGSWKRRR